MQGGGLSRKDFHTYSIQHKETDKFLKNLAEKLTCKK